MTERTAQIIEFPTRQAAERWFTTAELAEHLGMSPRWVAYQVKAGMPSQCFGRARRFSLSEVESWLQRQAG